MFRSFFPNPKWFFSSAIIYAILAMVLWYNFNEVLGAFIGLDLSEKEPIIGLGYFVTDTFLFFYLYYFLSFAIFSACWIIIAPHRWQWWSIVGSGIIIFATYISVQVSVALNHWRRPFGDSLQFALSGEQEVTAIQMYDLILIFGQIAFMWVAIYVINRFFVSHYIFRWRTAMNEYYTEHWKNVRHVEGAAQRVQEDTMRFASIMEGLGVAIIDAVMTLVAFLPLLWSLSKYVTELPIFGVIPSPLFAAAVTWSVFGTILLASVGVKLPGLEFKNQRVEAAYRKELVYGEDDDMRAQPQTLKELFQDVRKNYFKLYLHYGYFNIARGFYIQADNIFLFVILIPTIVSGTITYGIFSQISTAFSQVGSSFQFLVNSWTTIVELLSVRKRLVCFETEIDDAQSVT